MLRREFESDFGEEKKMPAELHERTPGVYVRADHELPHELDMLWSNSRAFHREERSPVLTFLAGLVIGIVVTSAVFLLIINPPRISTNVANILTPVEDQAEPARAQASPEAAQPGATEAAPSASSRTYTVQSGDTLGGIAYKVYGSSGPAYVDKIQRANNLSSPDAIQIDQKLVIPPKNY